MRATCDAISEVSANLDILPIGMGIGPFSLMTKLLADPITPINLAGDGETADSDSEVAIAVSAVEAGTSFLLDYFTAQIDAGAKAIIVCEPDANLVYFSPNQLNESFDTFDYFVTSPMRRIKELFDSQGVDLIFYDCGELTDGMVERFATLDPALLSLGCSRQLWKNAALVSKRTVYLAICLPKASCPPNLPLVRSSECLRNFLRTCMPRNIHSFSEASATYSVCQGLSAKS